MTEVSLPVQNTFFRLLDLFPSSKFQSFDKVQKNALCLHYYIAHGGKNKKHVPKMLDKNTSLVSKKDPEYGLTPFAVAIIAGDEDSAALLQEKGAEVECRDHKGWTPMHYAVFQGNMRMKKMLLDWGHREDLQTAAHLTPQSITDRLNVQPVDDEAVVFCYRNLESGSVIEGTALQFSKLTGGNFVGEILTSPQGLFKEWCSKKEEHSKHEDVFIEMLIPGYREFKVRPSRLYLDKSNSMGWGVFAKEKINRGEIVEEYFGERLGAAPEDNDYYLKVSDIDGKNFRNLGPMINDGFPNVYPMNIYNEAGVWIRTVFVAIDDIEAEEELYWDYGESHVSVKQHHVEKRMELIIQWLRTISDGKSLNIPDEPKERDIKKYLDYFGFSWKVRYLYNTPKTTFSLMLRGNLNPDLLYTLSGMVVPEEDSDFAANAQQMIGFAKLLQEEENVDLGKAIRAFMLQKLTQNSFLDLWPAICHYVGLKCKKEQLPTDWESLFTKLITMRVYVGEITEKENIDDASFRRFIAAAKEVPTYVQTQVQEQVLEFLQVNHPDRVDSFNQLLNN